MEQTHVVSNERGVRSIPKRLAAFRNAAISKGLMTDEAFQSALNLADPFPDDALQAVGWPSSTGASTIPLALTDYLNIQAPAGTVSSWNFKVIFVPALGTLASSGAVTIDMNTGVTTPGAPSAATWGQFNIWKWKDNDPEPNPMTTPPDQSIKLDPNTSWARARICSAGFEVINTSADLYRGGMQYGWRSPALLDPVQIFPLSSPSSYSVSAVQIMGGFPTSLSQVINLNTSFSGSGKNGIGVFSLPMAADNPTTQTLPTELFLLTGSGGTKEMRSFTRTALTIFNWMPCGSYHVGMALNATFQIKARIFYELMPNTETTRFIQAIVRPPVPHSFLLQELVDQMLIHTPCAFDYSENPLGEWFHKILGLMAHAAPIIGGLIPHPAAKVIAAAATPALAAAARATAPKKAAKKPVKETKLLTTKKNT